MKTATLKIPTFAYFLMSDEEIFNRLQRFGKQQGIADGTKVDLEYNHIRHNVEVKFTWGEG